MYLFNFYNNDFHSSPNANFINLFDFVTTLRDSKAFDKTAGICLGGNFNAKHPHEASAVPRPCTRGQTCHRSVELMEHLQTHDLSNVMASLLLPIMIIYLSRHSEAGAVLPQSTIFLSPPV